MKDNGRQLAPDDVSEQIRSLKSEAYAIPDYMHLFQKIFKVQYDEVNDDGVIVQIKGDSKSISLGLDFVF